MSTATTSTTTSKVYPDAVILAALSRIPQMGARSLRLLIEAAGSPQALWTASGAFIEQHVNAKIRTAFLQLRREGLDATWLETYRNLGIRVMAFTDPDYPPMLKEIHDPPMVLYIQGNVEALTGKTLAVVGTRRVSEYGRQVTDKLVGELAASGVCIVSGLAAGIDTAAHWAALEKRLPTVAVFGCGLDIIFPTGNRRLSQEIVAAGGALVSEYPLGTPGTRYTYPQRNRIVAGLSHGVLVVEGDVKSGALITARMALDEGRQVFAVPGNIFSPGSQGPLYLIKNGAVPVSRGEEMLAELSWWMPEAGVARPDADGSAEPTGKTGTDGNALPSEALSLSETERRLLLAIPFDPVAVDTLRDSSGLEAAQLGEALTMLELEGLIVLLPGAKVCRK